MQNHPTIRQKLSTAKKIFFFEGERFVTVQTSEGLVRIRMNLNGPPDVRQFIINPDLVKTTRQYRVMESLGFRPIDKLSMVYEKRTENQGVIKVRFFNSVIKEITVNGIPVKQFAVEVE
jgi:hypothetical protein